MVCDKSYHRLTVSEFCELISWENARNRHHVFPARLIRGASAKERLSRRQMETEFGINLKEVKLVPIAAHCFYNDIFRNSPPPVVLNKLSALVNGEYMLYRSKKMSFVKFSLCVVREKLRDNFSETIEAVEAINVDINNGNNLRVQGIIGILGLTEREIKFYLKEKFFPNNWEKLNPVLWNLYL